MTIPGWPIQLGATPIVVIDLETTGLHPSSDRIVEIAIVRLHPDGTVQDRWHTLVHPRRHPGPTHAHGLTMVDIENAPFFSQIADEVGERLDGAVVAAHNVNFDASFLRYEFARLERSAPAWPLLCTVRAAYRLSRVTYGRAGSRKLTDLCAREGVAHHGHHSALGDAEATAGLLGVYLGAARRAQLEFSDIGVYPTLLPAPYAPGGSMRSPAYPRD